MQNSKALIISCLLASAASLGAALPASASVTPRSDEVSMQPTGSIERELLAALATKALECTHQPFALKRGGHKKYGPVRSHCGDVQISEGRAEIRLHGRTYAVLVQDNENADGGDLNDLYVEFDAREDASALVQPNLLAFSDPIVALLLAAGLAPESLPEIFDASVL